jgi:protein-S-isoprenylcysteine O-methyltransferase Ste14
MVDERYFRIMFVLVFASVTMIRMYFHRRAKTFGANVYSREESRVTAVLRLALGIPFMVSIALYIFLPRTIAWAGVGLPPWLRIFGLLLAIAALAGLYWVHATLGENFSPTLQIKQQHVLVIRGPYRWVRHPMSSVLLALHIAYLLLAANWLVGLLGLLVIGMVMTMRTRAEEAMMIGQFGEQYRVYMQQTGRFLPLLARRSGPAPQA